MDDEDKLLFLLSGSYFALPESYVKLRSYYNVYSANVAEQQNLKLPKHLDNNFNCPYCYLPWNPATSSFKILPAKKLSADEKRKFKSDTSGNKEEIREASLPKNKMVLNCKVCGNKTIYPLKKQSKTSEVKVEVTGTTTSKKKKKKDKACGLKPKFVTHLKKTNTQSTTPAINQKNKTSLNNSKAITQNTSQSLIKKSTDSKVPVQKRNKNQNIVSKKAVINPHAVQNQHKISKKNNKKHKQLIQALKEDNSVRNTLKDFLSLVSR